MPTNLDDSREEYQSSTSISSHKSEASIDSTQSRLKQFSTSVKSSVINTVTEAATLAKDKLAHATTIAVNQSTKAGWLPLHIACKNGHLDIVKALLKQPKINVRKRFCEHSHSNISDE